MLTRRHLLASAGALAVSPRRAFAQTGYPSKPITMMVGYAAGGGVDLVALLLQEPMKNALGQPIELAAPRVRATGLSVEADHNDGRLRGRWRRRSRRAPAAGADEKRAGAADRARRAARSRNRTIRRSRSQ